MASFVPIKSNMDKDIFTEKYCAMYRAMIQKDGLALDNLLDESFVLVHMTGMRQNKQAFIRAIQNGTLNYFSEDLQSAEVKESNSGILFTGKSLFFG